MLNNAKTYFFLLFLKGNEEKRLTCNSSTVFWSQGFGVCLRFTSFPGFIA